jgi:hypothetical protein
MNAVGGDACAAGSAGVAKVRPPSANTALNMASLLLRMKRFINPFLSGDVPYLRQVSFVASWSSLHAA